MTEHEKKPGVRLKMLRCRRTGEDYDLSVHEQCPYCFGERKELETGDYAEFCDFRRGKDPVHFGFPEGSTRHEHG